MVWPVSRFQHLCAFDGFPIGIGAKKGTTDCGPRKGEDVGCAFDLQT